MRLRRAKHQPVRRAPISTDPVGDALAGVGEVASRFPGEVLDPDKLRELITVYAVEPGEIEGFNTVLGFDDEVVGWLEDPLVVQPPGPLWEKAEVAARWGMREEASALLRFGNRKQRQHRTKSAAVAEKYQLRAAK